MRSASHREMGPDLALVPDNESITTEAAITGTLTHCQPLRRLFDATPVTNSAPTLRDSRALMPRSCQHPSAANHGERRQQKVVHGDAVGHPLGVIFSNAGPLHLHLHLHTSSSLRHPCRAYSEYTHVDSHLPRQNSPVPVKYRGRLGRRVAALRRAVWGCRAPAPPTAAMLAMLTPAVACSSTMAAPPNLGLWECLPRTSLVASCTCTCLHLT